MSGTPSARILLPVLGLALAELLSYWTAGLDWALLTLSIVVVAEQESARSAQLRCCLLVTPSV